MIRQLRNDVKQSQNHLASVIYEKNFLKEVLTGVTSTQTRYGTLKVIPNILYVNKNTYL